MVLNAQPESRSPDHHKCFQFGGSASWKAPLQSWRLASWWSLFDPASNDNTRCCQVFDPEAAIRVSFWKQLPPVTYPLLQDVGTPNLVIWTSIISIDLWHRNRGVLFDPLESCNLDMPQAGMRWGMTCAMGKLTSDWTLIRRSSSGNSPPPPSAILTRAITSLPFSKVRRKTY